MVAPQRPHRSPIINDQFNDWYFSRMYARERGRLDVGQSSSLSSPKIIFRTLDGGCAVGVSRECVRARLCSHTIPYLVSFNACKYSCQLNMPFNQDKLWRKKKSNEFLAKHAARKLHLMFACVLDAGRSLWECVIHHNFGNHFNWILHVLRSFAFPRFVRHYGHGMTCFRLAITPSSHPCDAKLEPRTGGDLNMRAKQKR